MGLIGAAFGARLRARARPSAPLFSAIDHRLPFFVAAGAGGAEPADRLAPPARVARPGAPRRRPPRASSWCAAPWRAASSRRWCWLSFVATFAFVGMESTFALFGERRFDYSAAEVGLLFVYIGVMAAVAQGLLVGRVVERYGEARVMIGGLVGHGARAAAGGASPTTCGCC